MPETDIKTERSNCPKTSISEWSLVELKVLLKCTENESFCVAKLKYQNFETDFVMLERDLSFVDEKLFVYNCSDVVLEVKRNSSLSIIIFFKMEIAPPSCKYAIQKLN